MDSDDIKASSFECNCEGYFQDFSNDIKKFGKSWKFGRIGWSLLIKRPPPPHVGILDNSGMVKKQFWAQIIYIICPNKIPNFLRPDPNQSNVDGMEFPLSFDHQRGDERTAEAIVRKTMFVNKYKNFTCQRFHKISLIAQNLVKFHLWYVLN